MSVSSHPPILPSPSASSLSFEEALQTACSRLEEIGKRRTNTLPLEEQSISFAHEVQENSILYNNLDTPSKELLVQLATKRLCGQRWLFSILPVVWKTCVAMLRQEAPNFCDPFQGNMRHTSKAVRLCSMTYHAYHLRLYASRREICQHLITQALIHSAPAEGIAIDDGAGNGVASLLMAIQMGATGCVLCAEPDPSLHKVLHNNLTLNPQLTRRIRLYDTELFPQVLEEMQKLQAESNRPLRLVRLNCPGKATQRLRLLEPLVQRCKPKLFIRLQRNSNDWTNIPEMFCELFPFYSLQIHSHNVDANSVVLYASADSQYPTLPHFAHKPEHLLSNPDEVTAHRLQTEDYLYNLQQNILELSDLYLKTDK